MRVESRRNNTATPTTPNAPAHLIQGKVACVCGLVYQAISPWEVCAEFCCLPQWIERLEHSTLEVREAIIDVTNSCMSLASASL